MNRLKRCLNLFYIKFLIPTEDVFTDQLTYHDIQIYPNAEEPTTPSSGQTIALASEQEANSLPQPGGQVTEAVSEVRFDF